MLLEPYAPIIPLYPAVSTTPPIKPVLEFAPKNCIWYTLPFPLLPLLYTARSWWLFGLAM